MLFHVYISLIFQNACYFQNRSLLNRAKDLAAKKDITSLEDLMHSEVCVKCHFICHLNCSDVIVLPFQS